MTGTRTKKQHFVPRFYLSRFTDEAGFVWTYDSEGAEPRPATPENTAVSSNFYSVQQEDGTYIDQLETTLGIVETTAAPLHERVVAGEILRGADREEYVSFLVLQYLRSPVMINAIADASGQLVQLATRASVGDRKNFERQIDKWDEETGHPTSADDRDHIFDGLTKPGKLRVEVSRQRGLMALAFAENIIPLVIGMRWNICEAKEKRFVTSDNPVVRFVPRDERSLVYGDGGFIHPELEISFPLSPSKMLMLHRHRDVPESSDWEVKGEAVKRMNRRRAMNSDRYLYASERDNGIQALANKYHGAKPRLNVGNGRPMFPIEIVRKLGR